MEETKYAVRWDLFLLKGKIRIAVDVLKDSEMRSRIPIMDIEIDKHQTDNDYGQAWMTEKELDRLINKLIGIQTKEFM